MGYSQTKIGRLSVVESSAWGATDADFAAADSSSDSKAIDCEPPSLTLTQQPLTIDGLRPSFEEPTHLAGSKMESTMSFKMFLNGWDSSTPTLDPASSNLHPAGLLFKHALGGYSGATHRGDLSGGSVSSIEVTDSSSVKAGQAYCLPTSTSNVNGVVWIKSIDSSGSPHLLTPLTNMSVAPASTGTLYAGHVVYLDSSQLSVPLSFQWQGSDSATCIKMFDCSITSLKMTLSPLGPPELDVEVAIGNWSSESSGGDPSAYGYKYPTVNASIGTNGARLMLNGAEQQSVSMELDITADYANALSHYASQGLAQRVCTNRTVTASLTVPAQTLNSDLAAPGDAKGTLQLDLNANTFGNAMSLTIPTTVVRESSPIGDSDGLVSVAYTLGCDLYTADDGSTAPADTPFRVAFL